MIEEADVSSIIMTNTWKDIWKEEPPRNEDIFFLMGDDSIHLGIIFSNEKLRKCKFHSYTTSDDYECDLLTDYIDRVLYWFPIPIVPLKENN